MTYIDWHLGIRKAYPDALLSITGETIEELVVIDQETGEPFDFNQSAAELAYANVVAGRSFNSLRAKRNQLLAETDYLGLPDLGGFSAEMTAYRQALRDLPANTADPANPVWPTKP